MVHFVPDAENRARLAEVIVESRHLARSVAVQLTYRDLLNAGPADVTRLRGDIASLQEALTRISLGLETDAVTTFRGPSETV